MQPEKFSSTLPADFDGVFRFTNPSEEDFVAKWDSKEYLFPARTTSPIIITNATTVEIQAIRRKFAKDLAEREYFKSEKYRKLEATERNADGSPRFNSFKQAGSYSLDDLAEYTQRCLDPLPVSHALVRDVPSEDMTEKLARDERTNETVTEVLEPKVSLKERAKNAS